MTSSEPRWRICPTCGVLRPAETLAGGTNRCLNLTDCLAAAKELIYVREAGR